MNVVHYQHRQFGTVTVWSLSLGALLCLSLGSIRQPGSDFELGIAALFIFCAYLFSSLTVEVTDTTLRWQRGTAARSVRTASLKSSTSGRSSSCTCTPLGQGSR